MSSSSASILNRLRSGANSTRVKSFLPLWDEIFAGPCVRAMLSTHVCESFWPEAESAVSTVKDVEKMLASLAP